MTLNPILNATDDAEQALDSGVDNVIAAAEQLRANVKHHLQRIRAAVATAQSAVGNLAVTTSNNPAATPAQQRAVVNAQRDVDRLAQQGQQAANSGNNAAVDTTVDQLNAIADAANRANAAQAPAPAAPVATTPAQPAQAQPPAPAAPVATTPAAGSNTPANLWFVGDHPNSQPISPVGTDAWGRQVDAALDNHRDGLNILRGEVNDINRHLGRQNGPNGPTYRPIGNGNGDYSPLIVVLCIVVGGFLGWLLGHQFLTLNWGFFGPDGGIFFGALAGAIASIWLAKKH